MQVSTLDIGSAHDEECARRIQFAVYREPGVQLCSIGLEAGQVHVVFDEKHTSVGRLQKLIEQIGYGARPAR